MNQRHKHKTNQSGFFRFLAASKPVGCYSTTGAEAASLPHSIGESQIKV